MLGLPGRDEQIENYQQLIRNAGKAGIPLLWSHYAYFIKAVIPVAEEAGVKRALHPDDPCSDDG
ncbi:mannonate dehydratase [Paenibacillus periandrae]|uniref:mannonate dehydratase n=1 Tax=Paenibacillus periandrae TaxID=1761741 RepID=UPI001F09ED93|nr:mannonate dehydratase [Paenibacillus periandrae]